MAQVTVQVAVSSVATNSDYANRVYKGWETFSITVKGESITKKRLWTFWLDWPGSFGKGDVVEFTGELGTKVADFEKDGKTLQVVEHSLGKATGKLIHSGSREQSTPAESEAAF